MTFDAALFSLNDAMQSVENKIIIIFLSFSVSPSLCCIIFLNAYMSADEDIKATMCQMFFFFFLLGQRGYYFTS